MPRLSFFGAAQTVTGSKYLLEAGEARVLFDAGLFQGLKELRLRNWDPLPVPAASLDAIVLTHAHLDHTGFLPRLVSDGFRGRIFCTAGTADLCRLVLPDAARLQEDDAADANRRGYSRHHPALPLFTEADAYRTLTQLQPLGYDRPISPAVGLTITFVPVGHLLGAAAVLVDLPGGRRLVFGGDLGRYDRPVLRDPRSISRADVLLIESTYGDRTHEPDDKGERLGQIIRDTIAREGKVVIPSFALGRVEEVLYWLRCLEQERRIPIVPVFLDSPMATQALQYYANRRTELDDELHDGKGLASFATSRFRCVASPQQSAELVASRTPAIIVSSSGMATGGRVLHHLVRVLPDERNTVLFVGYQAPGTRGRALVGGAPEVKMHGRPVPVAARIEQIDSLSAHADATEMIRWLGGFERPPDVTYIVHGERPAMDALEQRIAAGLGTGWATHIPAYLDAVEI
jgi:metallo-beta-lactamase family protein